MDNSIRFISGKKLLATIVICGTVASSTFALSTRSDRRPSSSAPFTYGMEQASHYLTFSHSTQVTGPTLAVSGAQEYVTQIFRTLVSEGDSLGREYRMAGATNSLDAGAYWAFMVASITVPFHESKYQHFRELPQLGSLCQQNVNSGSILVGRIQTSKAGHGELSRAYNNFKRVFRQGPEQISPDCNRLEAGDHAIQLVGSSDGLSLGMLQLDMAYHQEYFTDGLFKDVRDTARYGLNFYKEAGGSSRGFDGLLQNYRKYSCLNRGGTIDFEGLVRGAWSIYNGGIGGSPCRFAISRNLNDQMFEVHLRTILLEVDRPDNYLTQYLQGPDLAAYHEIIDNFKNHRNSHTALDHLLSVIKNGGSSSESPAPAATSAASSSDQPTADANSLAIQTKVLVGSVRVRTSPSLEAPVCGTVRANTNVQIVAQAEGGLWSQVRFDSDTEKNDLSGCAGQEYVITSALSGDAGVLPGASAKVQHGVVVKAHALNVRSSAPAGAVIRVLHEGDSVQIIGSKKLDSNSPAPWYQILPDHGWVYGDAIQIQE